MRESKGFSLLEVMVAMVVLSVVATGILGTTVYQKRSSSIGTQKLVALQAIEGKFVEFKSKGAKSLAVVPAVTAATRVAVPDLRNGVMEWTIIEPEPGNETWKRALVSVGWDMPEKAPSTTLKTVATCDQRVSMVTFLSEG